MTPLGVRVGRWHMMGWRAAVGNFGVAGNGGERWREGRGPQTLNNRRTKLTWWAKKGEARRRCMAVCMCVCIRVCVCVCVSVYS